MKGIDLSCASPASTAICSSMDQDSMVRLGTRRPIHRHSHPLTDQRKSRKSVPCSSDHLPIDPLLYLHQKSRKSSVKQQSSDHQLRRKSSADIHGLTSPPGNSSRYLLSDTPNNNSFELLPDSDHAPTTLVPSQKYTRPEHPSFKYKSPSLKSSSTPSNDQIVELRVSIHCKGCEGKVRKHISRMEGVTSFSVDLATKKVTVKGDVTPVGVLTSISKVKNAEFWPSPTSSSSSPWLA